MKTKYVFVIEADSFPPDDLGRCYIFDNFDDARSFYNRNGYDLEIYSSETKFCITNFSAKIKWYGDIFKGLYY